MGDDILRMTAKDAIKYVSDTYEDFRSMYSIAKALTGGELKVTTIQISNYLRGKHKMSGKVANRFYEVFDIVITDAYESDAVRRRYNV